MSALRCLPACVRASPTLENPTPTPAAWLLTAPLPPDDFAATGIDGEQVHLNRFSGRYSLVVCIATLEPAAEDTLAWMGRETLKHRRFGFEMLVFPSDEFPSSHRRDAQAQNNSAIAQHVRELLGEDHGMRLFAKTQVNRRCPPTNATAAESCAAASADCCPANHRVFETLREHEGGRGKTRTNFAKWLVSHEGFLLRRFDAMEPAAVVSEALDEIISHAPRRSAGEL